VQKRAQEKAAAKLRQLALESQTLPLKGAPLPRKLLSLLYRLLGRRLLARLMVTTDHCVQCRHCETVCPHRAIVFRFGLPFRNRRCRGCLWCVYQCPERAFVLPLSVLLGAFVLLWLPYDEYLAPLFSVAIFPARRDAVGVGFSLLFWTIGYGVAIFILTRLSLFVSVIPAVRRLRARPFFLAIARAIHPATIFPILVPPEARKKAR